jgi:peroxiredoxin
MLRHPLQRSLVFLIPLALAGLTASSAVAVNNSDFDQAKKRALELADKLTSYEIKADLVVDQKPRGAAQGMKLEAVQTAAARMPDRLLVKVENQMFSQTWGTGPASSWFFLPQNNVLYQGQPAILKRELDNGEPRGLEEEQLFNFYAGLGEFLLTSDQDVSPVTGQATLAVAGKDIDCQVFEFKVTAEDGVTEQGHGEYWYDKKSGLVLKSLITTFGEQQGMVMERTMELTVTEFRLNGDVSEDLFAFTAPEGVRVVDTFDRLMNPDSMVGQTAPEITFTTFSGESIQLSSYKGKVVFLDFWATWCGPCRIEMPHIQALHDEMKSRGDVVFIGASNEPQKTIQDWLAKNPYTFKMVMVRPEDAQGKYNVTSIPAGFVIDRDGIIKAHMIGAQSEDQLRKALAKAGIN